MYLVGFHPGQEVQTEDTLKQSGPTTMYFNVSPDPTMYTAQCDYRSGAGAWCAAVGSVGVGVQSLGFYHAKQNSPLPLFPHL